MASAMVTTAGRAASLQVLTQGYTPAGPATLMLMGDPHDFQLDPATVADVAGEELVATGYARQLLAFDPVFVSSDGTTSQASTPTSFGLVGGAVDAKVTGCYVFEDSGNDATSVVTGCLMFVELKQTDGTELIARPITWQMARTII